MDYDEELAGRVRITLIDQRVVEEKRMMGGLTFMVNGKMCVRKGCLPWILRGSR